jgi:biotin operon repressor
VVLPWGRHGAAGRGRQESHGRSTRGRRGCEQAENQARGNYFCRSGEKAYLCKNKTQKTKTMKDQVLKAMREAGKPVSAGDVTKMLNADRKEVDKAFDALKKEGAIVSPVRCKWEPAK